MTIDPWQFLFVGYVITIAIETPVLLFGLAPRHLFSTRIFAGIWLTACTYPIVILVLPPICNPNHDARWLYLLVAETFAPAAEVALFLVAFGRSTWRRDAFVVTLANLASFGIGEIINRCFFE